MSGASPFAKFIVCVGCAIAVAIFGVAVVWIGRRGRRIDDHPLCRRCGFDLTGLPLESHRCPECGRELQGERSIRRGNRVRRTRLALVGLSVLLLALFAGGVGGVRLGREVDWPRQKPTWWLLLEARSSDTPTRDSAISLLIERDGNDAKLGEAAGRRLAERILDVQADQTKAWDNDWGDWFVARMAAGRASEAEIERYLHAVFDPVTLFARAHVRQGDPLPLSAVLGTSASRGSNGRSVLWVTHRAPQTLVEIDGVVVQQPTSAPDKYGLAYPMSGGASIETRVDPDALRNLGIGTHHVRITNEIRILGDIEEGVRTVVRTIPVDCETTFELHEADAPIIDLYRDESLRPMMTASFVPTLRKDQGDRFHLVFGPRTNVLPMHTAFRVTASQAGRVWQGPTIWLKPGPMPNYWTWIDLPNVQPGTIEIRLTPDLTDVIRSLDIYKIWDGELVYKDVPL